MAHMAFFLDGGRCTGCQTCVYACREYNGLPSGLFFRKACDYVAGETVRTAEGWHRSSCVAYSVSFSCNHCDRPACMEVCPTGAMHREETFGLVVVDGRRCIGCGYCHLSCPYGAPKVDRKMDRSMKCEGCFERLVAGQRPACVEACPVRALDFGEVADMKQRGERADIAPFPPSVETVPNLFVAPSPQAQAAADGSGAIENGPRRS